MRWLMRLLTPTDRKSTRLNSSHQLISYAVFCLKKKNQSMVSMLSMTTAAAFDEFTSKGKYQLFNLQNPFDWPNSFRSARFFFFLKNGHPPRSPLFPNAALSQ